MSSIKILRVGNRAPLFTLLNHRGNKVKLADCLKKNAVILFFYPGDLTPGCTMQLCAVRDDWTKFKRRQAAVFGLNHGDAESHNAFVKKYTLPFPLLIDKNKKISEKYGAVKRILNVKVIRRSVAVIDKNGKIIYLKRGMPKNSEILKSLA